MFFSKKRVIWPLVFALTTAAALPLNDQSAYASVQESSGAEVGYDENGNKLYLTKTNENGIETATVTNESGEKVASFSVDTTNDVAYLNDEKLTDKQFDELKSLKSGDMHQINSTTWTYSNTLNGSLWVVKAGGAAAAAIATMIPGVGWAAALSAASAIVGATGTVYYRTYIYHRSDSQYFYVKRSTHFYSDSSRTNKLFGPLVGTQKSPLGIGVQ